MTRCRQSPEVNYDKAARWGEACAWLKVNAPEWVWDAVQHTHFNLVASLKRYRDENAQTQKVVHTERMEKKKLQRVLNSIPFEDEEK